MTGLTIEVKGLIDNLENLPKEVEKKMVQELRVTGLMIESDYKIAVPVDTGRLRSSIHTEHSGFRNFTYNNKQGDIFDGKLSINPNDRQVVVGTNVEYSTIIEERGGKIKGKDALATAFKKNTAGLLNRLLKLI
jgi:hypothetical protein